MKRLKWETRLAAMAILCIFFSELTLGDERGPSGNRIADQNNLPPTFLRKLFQQRTGSKIISCCCWSETSQNNSKTVRSQEGSPSFRHSPVEFQLSMRLGSQAVLQSYP